MSGLELAGLRAGYGPVTVVHGIDLTAGPGEVVCLLGANGAGKTTTLRAISGLVTASGHLSWRGEDLLGLPPEQIAQRGIAHVPQGRAIYAQLTVEENLTVGADWRLPRREVARRLERNFVMFPRLRERRRQRGGTLSGGEQQMLAVARALMSTPRLLMLDEPSLGLAPLAARELYEHLARIRSGGVGLLLVEQSAELALRLADRAYVLESGRIALTGPADDIRANDGARRAYLGY